MKNEQQEKTQKGKTYTNLYDAIFDLPASYLILDFLSYTNKDALTITIQEANSSLFTPQGSTRNMWKKFFNPLKCKLAEQVLQLQINYFDYKGGTTEENHRKLRQKYGCWKEYTEKDQLALSDHKDFMDEFIKKSVVVTEEQMKEKEKNNE